MQNLAYRLHFAPRFEELGQVQRLERQLQEEDSYLLVLPQEVLSRQVGEVSACFEQGLRTMWQELEGSDVRGKDARIEAGVNSEPESEPKPERMSEQDQSALHLAPQMPRFWTVRLQAPLSLHPLRLEEVLDLQEKPEYQLQEGQSPFVIFVRHDNEKLDQLLRKSRELGLKLPELKAVSTPHNQAWPLEKLALELAAEHRLMKSYEKFRRMLSLVPELKKEEASYTKESWQQFEDLANRLEEASRDPEQLSEQWLQTSVADLSRAYLSLVTKPSEAE